MSKQYSIREVREMFKSNGYQHIRTKGSHELWSNGVKTLALPVVKLNYKVGNKLVRECGYA